METMKKAWKDASSTPEGAERDKASADGSYLEVKLPDLLVTSYQTSAAPDFRARWRATARAS